MLVTIKKRSEETGTLRLKDCPVGFSVLEWETRGHFVLAYRQEASSTRVEVFENCHSFYYYFFKSEVVLLSIAPVKELEVKC